MQKYLLYLGLFLGFLSSCEEIYEPEIDVMPPMLVVESNITNDLNQNFVRLSLSHDFYGTTNPSKVFGAKVDLIEVGGKTVINGLDQEAGYFKFQTAPVIGKQYLLRVRYMNDLYESVAVTMPPIPDLDSFYTKHAIQKEYITSSSGVPLQTETPVREITIDAPITAKNAYYLFNWRAVLQWIYTPPEGPREPPLPTWYGWRSLVGYGNFNLAGPKEFSVSTQIKNHPVFSLKYDSRQYLDSASQYGAGWIVILDQFSITKDSYDFHKKLNSQFSAEGNLFDPVLTQVFGNMRCTNDPSKIVLGLFDLKSYRQHRYFLNNFWAGENGIIIRRLDTYPDIPVDGYTLDEYPPFWEHNIPQR